MANIEHDLEDLKAFLNEHIVAINILDLIQYYESQIEGLKRERDEAVNNNARDFFAN